MYKVSIYLLFVLLTVIAPIGAAVNLEAVALYEAARYGNERRIEEIMRNNPDRTCEDMLKEALEYAKSRNDAFTTRNLTEKLINNEKTWFERHPYITMFATTILVGAAMFMIRLKFFSGPQLEAQQAGWDGNQISMPVEGIDYEASEKRRQVVNQRLAARAERARLVADQARQDIATALGRNA